MPSGGYIAMFVT